MSQVAQVTPLPKRESWTKSGPVVSHLPQDEIEFLEERATATIAAPAPLGLWDFATGTWITGTVIAGMFPPTALTATIPVLLIFAGLTQFIAGLFAFRRANVLSATAFCSFGAFNVLTAPVVRHAGDRQADHHWRSGDPAGLRAGIVCLHRAGSDAGCSQNQRSADFDPICRLNSSRLTSNFPMTRSSRSQGTRSMSTVPEQGDCTTAFNFFPSSDLTNVRKKGRAVFSM